MRFWAARPAKRAALPGPVSGQPVILGAMGRPSLGAAAKTIVGNTKITADEQAALTTRFGSVHRGLRAALDAHLSGRSKIGGVPILAGAGASRTVVANTKISKNEQATLVARHGSVHAGLRTALDEMVDKHAKPQGDVLVFTQDTLVETGRCRVHKSYREIRRYYELGVEYVEKECADCGTRTTGRVRS